MTRLATATMMKSEGRLSFFGRVERVGRLKADAHLFSDWPIEMCGWTHARAQEQTLQPSHGQALRRGAKARMPRPRHWRPGTTGGDGDSGDTQKDNFVSTRTVLDSAALQVQVQVELQVQLPEA